MPLCKKNNACASYQCGAVLGGVGLGLGLKLRCNRVSLRFRHSGGLNIAAGSLIFRHSMLEFTMPFKFYERSSSRKDSG